ncbi:MAG: hypothetical protein M0P43_09180 [Arcobacteraceae bacterium]|jgi:hypothetical protein|nr:hypothetical protein [Arcobacteraceae bacterium]MDY0328683.1 hypothetical protein [Arcobacteraceae bacterium]
MFTDEVVEILSKHIELVHHLKGRVRFKLDTNIQKYKETIDLSGLENLDKKIDGIKSVSLNKLAKSLTIEYDHNKISMQLWDDLSKNKNYSEVAFQLNSLIK